MSALKQLILQQAERLNGRDSLTEQERLLVTLAEAVAELLDVSQQTLEQTRRTNGRTTALEAAHSRMPCTSHAARFDKLETSVTRINLRLAGWAGAIGAVAGLSSQLAGKIIGL